MTEKVTGLHHRERLSCLASVLPEPGNVDMATCTEKGQSLCGQVWCDQEEKKTSTMCLPNPKVTVSLYQHQLSVHPSTLSNAGIWRHRDMGDQAHCYTQWKKLPATLTCKMEAMEGNGHGHRHWVRIPALPSLAAASPQTILTLGFLVPSIAAYL